ncbi:MAG: DUF4157 domain-containing protein [Okeania sp. SIO1H6]|nr:DUF4157 domain-containing protein [Okeania sp. SIO1H6]
MTGVKDFGYSPKEPMVQREGMEEGVLFRRAVVNRKDGYAGGEATGDLETAIAKARVSETVGGSEALLQAVRTQEKSSAPIQAKVAETANKTGLPDSLKTGIENLSGYYMDDVKVHYNSDQPARLQAHAYAQGSDIHIAPGQEKHLPHEAWHVVQQKQGRVKPTMQKKGGVKVNEDTGLEKEANVMGKKAQFLSNLVMSVQSKANPKTSITAKVRPPIQRNGDKSQRQTNDEYASNTYKSALFFNTLANIPESNRLAQLLGKYTATTTGVTQLHMAEQEYKKNKGEVTTGFITKVISGLSYITEGIGETVHIAHMMDKDLKIPSRLMNIAPIAGAVADFTQAKYYLGKEEYTKAAMYSGVGAANVMSMYPTQVLPKQFALGCAAAVQTMIEFNQFGRNILSSQDPDLWQQQLDLL